MIRLRQSGVDEVLIKRVRDWYDPGPGCFFSGVTGVASFDPASLFTTGVNGAWYDPSDFSTLFQDAAGTTPVTAVEQPVGRMLDKSGKGNHAFNPTAVGTANFPVLQQDGTGRYYLAFNGANQWLQTNSIDFTNTAQMFVSAGVRKLSDYMGEATAAIIAEVSSNVAANNGSWALTGSIGYGSNRKYTFQSKGTLSFVEANTTNASYAAPVTNIVSGISDLNGSPSDYARLKVNNTQVAENTADQGTDNFGNYPLYIGARAGTSLWANIRLYQLVVAGKQASADEITNTETFINQKTGAY